jgi:hypothetical protein
MAVLDALPDFLTARENYLRAMGRHDAQQRRLFELFGVSNLADLDLAMLNNRGKHANEIAEYDRLGNIFDRCADIYDRVAARQRQKVREQQKQFNAIFEALDE